MTDYDVHKYIKTNTDTVTVYGIQFRPSSCGGDIKEALFTVTRKGAFGKYANEFAKNAAEVFNTGNDKYVDVI